MNRIMTRLVRWLILKYGDRIEAPSRDKPGWVDDYRVLWGALVWKASYIAPPRHASCKCALSEDQ